MRNSLHEMLEMAESSKNQVNSSQWNTIYCNVEQMDFLFKALSGIRQKVLNRLGVRMQDKSREERIKEINRLNRQLYSD